MGYISLRKQRIQARLTVVQSQITKLETVLDEMSATGAVSYSFDSGEGQQRTTRRSLKEINDLLSQLYARESSLINDLYNMGIVAVKLRRRPSNVR
jgi:hypothetical protein